jgi:DNA polymerase-3 subunit gamma/tau
MSLPVSYTVFARKYRPQTFDEIVGQEHIVRTLKNAIEQSRLAQAYLFVGPRGTGKTSTARIFAKALNCVNAPTVSPCGVCDMCREIAAGNSLNVLEFDAASNTQVDKIREIILETVKFAPASGQYKLYIIDEVHMLSTASFNALLKTLEEPPAHVKFVFATTDVQKVPTTIVSRCQRFDLQRIATPAIAKHLLFIAGKEKLTLTPEAADAVARGAEGGLRDAESMLDQLVAFCGEKIDESNVLEVFGFTSLHTIAALGGHILARAASPALALVHQQAEAGKDLSRLLGDLITHCRNLLVVKADPGGLSNEFTAEAVAALAAQAESVPMEKLLTLIEQFAGAESRMKWAANKKMHFEVAVIRAIQTLGQATLDEVLETLTELRGGGAGKSEVGSRKSESAGAKATLLAAGSLSAAVASVIAAPAKAAPAPIPPAAIVREEPAKPATVAMAAPEDLWPKAVARIRQERPLVMTWVQAGTLLGIEGDTAVLGFPPEADLAREACDKPQQRGFLEGVFSSLAGRKLTLRCVKKEGLVVAPIAFAEEPKVAPKDPMAEFRDDPLIRRALEEFKAEIVEG